MFSPKLRTVKPGDALENPAFELWFEDVKGHREADLQLFVKQIPPIDSCHQVAFLFSGITVRFLGVMVGIF
jgi:hypothetical protein